MTFGVWFQIPAQTSIGAGSWARVVPGDQQMWPYLEKLSGHHLCCCRLKTGVPGDPDPSERGEKNLTLPRIHFPTSSCFTRSTEFPQWAVGLPMMDWICEWGDVWKEKWVADKTSDRGRLNYKYPSNRHEFTASLNWEIIDAFKRKNKTKKLPKNLIAVLRADCCLHFSV